MRIYTRTGDDGTTALGSRRRVPKDDLRIEAYGTVDELNAVLGLALATGLEPRLADVLLRVQDELFRLGADLCVPEEEKERYPVPRVEAGHVEALEALMDELDSDLPALRNFVLPGGSAAAATLHIARTVARRCERRLVALAREQSVQEQAVRYVNRLSDALFVMARWQNHASGVGDVVWRPPERSGED